VSERAPYSRVYWSVIDDPKFAGVYDDNAAFAWWVRLLMIADQAYPASAHLPAGVSRQTLKTLTDCGLIDKQAGGRFRVHGLDAERRRRSDMARASADARWSDTGRNADAMRTHTGRIANGMLDEKRREETRRDETSLDEDEPHVVAYFNATGRAPSALQRAKLWEWWDRHSTAWLVEHLVGDDPFRSAMDADTAWQNERRKAVAAEEAEARREKKRQAYLDKQALMRISTEVPA